MNAQQEIEVLIRAKYPLLYVLTWEEERVSKLLLDLAIRLKRKLYTWSLTDGVHPLPPRSPETPSRLSPDLEILTRIYACQEEGIFHLKDFHPYIHDLRVVRLLRDLSHRLRQRSQCVVITAPVLRLPIELEKDVSVVEFPLPEANDIAEVLQSACEAMQDKANVNVSLTSEEREQVIKSCLGLTLDEVEAVLARSLVEKKRFDVEVILQEKRQIVRKSGLLEYYPASETLNDVGGMEYLKEWLMHRTRAFTEKAREFGLPPPKGILLIGVQGCGKSLIAKTIANLWNLPLLRMDVGRIFGSLVGQSEDNIRRAIRVAESVSPCILWTDELEKGFSGLQSSGFSDSGTTARVFATFLTWMQEKTKPVFVVATANDVTQLPPEMIRKGRFDEIFFIDLPDKYEREDIFKIHLQKRKRDPNAFDVKKLADITLGFSGAEIEQVVIGALHRAFSHDRDLTQEDLETEAHATVPLSRMMKEDIDALREWARLRARPASRCDE